MDKIDKKIFKILILVGATNVTGPVKGVLQLMENFEALSIDFICVNCIDPKANTNEVKEAARMYEQKIEECRVNSRNYLGYIFSIRKIVTKERINVIQTHGYKETFAGLVLKFSTGVKWICFMHGRTTENMKVRIYNFLDSLMQIFSDRTILVTNRQRSSIICGKNQERVIVIPNAIDIDSTKKLAKMKNSSLSFNSKLNDLKIVVIARLSPEKGIDVFLEALSLVINNEIMIKAVIIGDGPEKQNLIDSCVRFNLDKDHVEILGYQINPLPYLSSSDCLVLPSRTEGCPNVILEAMALGKAVIASDVGGVPDLVIPNETGLIVPPDSPEDLAEAMIKFSFDRRMVKKMGERAIQIVQRNFSPKNRTKKIISLYERVLNQ